MSELTNRLLDEGLILSKRSFRDQCGGPDCALSANLAYEAANRIDALEECLRGLVKALADSDEEGLIEHAEPIQRARALLEAHD